MSVTARSLAEYAEKAFFHSRLEKVVDKKLRLPIMLKVAGPTYTEAVKDGVNGCLAPDSKSKLIDDPRSFVDRVHNIGAGVYILGYEIGRALDRETKATELATGTNDDGSIGNTLVVLYQPLYFALLENFFDSRIDIAAAEKAVRESPLVQRLIDSDAVPM